jgi:hypothetical protein
MISKRASLGTTISLMSLKISNTEVSGAKKGKSGEELENWSSMTDNFIKDRYRTSCSMEKADWLCQMEIFIKDLGLMARNREKDFITMQRANRFMTETGKTIKNTDPVLYKLKMDLFMSESLFLTRKMVKENSLLKVEYMKVTLLTENIMDKENCYLLTKDRCILEALKIIWCTDKAKWWCQTIPDSEENGKKVKCQDKEQKYMQTAIDILVKLIITSHMELVFGST